MQLMGRHIAAALVVAILAGLALAQDEMASVSVARRGETRATVRAALSTQGLQPGQQAVAAVVLDIKPGFHAQSNAPLDKYLIKTEVTLQPSPAIKALAPVYPPGEIVTYPSLGKLSVYTGKAIIYVPLEVKSDAAPGATKLAGTITYQICDDHNCFEPVNAPFAIETSIVPTGQPLTPNEPELFARFDPKVFAQGGAAASSSAITGESLFGPLGQRSYLLAFLSAFFVGVIFNVMPCVLPVVPLKAIGFYEVSQHNRARSLLLGFVFSLGLVAMFAVLALVVVVFKTLTWGEQFSNPWFVGGIIAILVLMALSTFGFFTVLLPTGVYRFTPQHDTLMGNFLFGILTAVLSTPCTLGMFVGLLAWAASQPSIIGVAVVMTVGVGMAFPYLLLSAFPEMARRMPRTGPWAELVKQMMGFLLLAVAAYFAGTFMSGRSYLWVVFGITAAASLYLIVRTARFAPRLVPIGVATCIGLLLTGGVLAATLRLTRGGIEWQPYSPAALEQAKAGGKIVMVEFTANWCGNCLYLEANVLHDPRTLAAIKQHGVVALRADLSRENPPAQQLLRQLNASGGIPLTAIFAPKADKPIQLSGIYSVENLQQALAEATGPAVAKN